MSTVKSTVPTIGTPLTPNATKVLLLGAGELGRDLAVAFQNLGLEVHAVDRYEGAPALQIAHRAYIADINDDAAVLKLAEEIRPHFVVPEVETVAVGALRTLEEQTSAVVVPTAHACETTKDRESTRAVASDKLGLPTTAYKFAHSVDELREAVAELGYPCVIKPDQSTSGKGHMIVRDESDIELAWNRVRRIGSDAERVTAERFVDFDFEVTMLVVRSIDPATGELATWFSEPIGHRHDNGDLVESWQPLAMNERALDNARSVAARITNELGGRGVYGVELFVAGEDVYFSSVSPRPSDAGMLTHHTQRFSEFDLHARAILGYPIDVTLTSPGAAVVLHADEEIEQVGYTGVAEAMRYAETDVRLFGKPGAYAGRRMGLVVATAENVEEARDRAALAASSIAVVDTQSADRATDQTPARGQG
ncbi:formate-dependent phosphoribosylglycinamide formyltransferase [Corynebacterium incognita]|uniref:formate-dependent phosphoribosylglycinamide formyltransferase n=1 Tax=Corynebacterium incognita TaxID=2754725 RepID=UPI003CCDB4CF